MRKNLRIGDVLVEEGLVSPNQLKEALEQQRTPINKGKRVGDLLVNLGYVSEHQLIKALSKKLNVPYIDLENYPIKNEIANILDEKLARDFNAVPIAKNEKDLTVAMSDPLNLYAIEEMRLSTKHNIIPVISTKKAITRIIERCYSGRQALMAAQELQKELTMRELIEVGAAVDGSNAIDSAPVVKMVNSMIEQGVRLLASDIHIEASKDYTRVRLRIDGELQEQMRLNKGAHDAVITRLKIMGGMNIAEKRIPQDGRFEIIVDHQKIDVRASCLPTTYGEKMVLRLLNTQSIHVSKISDLGLTEQNQAIFNSIIKSPHGIVLVTGPTGSGKSTTLYAVLSEKNTPTSNIITLEDPIEKKIEGINQVQINTKAGLTFASGLRSILRQDPDTIMVGEIRDAETASIAIRSAITGHLVFSTLHTNDAASTITRLVDMGIEPYMVSSALVGVVAQRLARKICPNCMEEYWCSEEERLLLKLEQPEMLKRGTGCQTCNFTGYRGRTAIHEVIAVTSDLKILINQGAQAEEIRAHAVKQGTILLQDNMKTLVLAGITTPEEYIKITYSID